MIYMSTHSIGFVEFYRFLPFPVPSLLIAGNLKLEVIRFGFLTVVIISCAAY